MSLLHEAIIAEKYGLRLTVDQMADALGHARFHDLRHSTASELVNAGVDLFTVGGVLGHKSQASTARYAHLSQDRMREAMAGIGKRNK